MWMLLVTGMLLSAALPSQLASGDVPPEEKAAIARSLGSFLTPCTYEVSRVRIVLEEGDPFFEAAKALLLGIVEGSVACPDASAFVDERIHLDGVDEHAWRVTSTEGAVLRRDVGEERNPAILRTDQVQLFWDARSATLGLERASYNVILYDPYALMQPIPSSPTQLRTLEEWAWSKGAEDENTLWVQVRNLGTPSVVLDLRLKGVPQYLPLYAGMATGDGSESDHGIYEYGEDNGRLHPRSIFHVQERRGGRVLVLIRYRLTDFEHEVAQLPRLLIARPRQILDKRHGTQAVADLADLPLEIRKHVHVQ